METQKSYVPTNCSKCGAQNNAARYTSCRLCGGQLEQSTQTGRNTGSPGRSKKSGSLGGYLVSGLLLLLVAGGSTYFFYDKFSGQPSGAAKRPASRDVPLPTASWHNKSWLSMITKYPSAGDVFAKYLEVNNGPADTTIVLSGKFSQARGSCYTQACLDKADENRVDPATGYKLKVVKTPLPAGAPTPSPLPELLWRDAHASLNYTESGTIEISAKAPDKSIKKVVARQPGASDWVEITELFSSGSGVRSTASGNSARGASSPNVLTMTDAEAESAKSELASLSKRDFSDVKNARVAAVEKVNDNVVFVVTAQNKQGSDDTYYFDTISGQIVKMDTKGVSIYFEDFKPSPSGPYPSTLFFRTEIEGGYHSWIKFEIEKWEAGGPIADSVFRLAENKVSRSLAADRLRVNRIPR
jgi:hypothetical protein